MDGNLVHLDIGPGSKLPPGEFAVFLGHDPEALSAPVGSQVTMGTVAFSAISSQLFAWSGSEDRPHYVLLPIATPPAAGVFRSWHQLALSYRVRVLPVPPSALRAAVLNNSALEHLHDAIRRAGQPNPFELQGPITNELDFFGSRQELAQRLEDIATEKCGFGIFGLQKWGTTSMLLRLRSALHDRISAWVDMAALPDLSPLTVLNKIVHEFERDLRAKAPSWSSEATVVSSTVPAANERLQQLSLICKEHRLSVPPVIFLDRVDELMRRMHETPGPVIELIKALYSICFAAREAEKLLLVVAGGDDEFLSRQEFDGEQGHYPNPFWRTMKTHYAPLFSQRETSEFLERLGAYAGLSFTKKALAAAYALTGGHKYLTRLLGAELCDMRTTSSVTPRLMARASEWLIAHHSDYLRAILSHAPRGTIALLRNTHNVQLSPLQILDLTNAVPQRIDGALSALKFALDYGLLRRDLSADSCVVAIGLLNEWLARTEGQPRDQVVPLESINETPSAATDQG